MSLKSTSQLGAPEASPVVISCTLIVEAPCPYYTPSRLTRDSFADPLYGVKNEPARVGRIERTPYEVDFRAPTFAFEICSWP